MGQSSDEALERAFVVRWQRDRFDYLMQCPKVELVRIILGRERDKYRESGVHVPDIVWELNAYYWDLREAYDDVTRTTEVAKANMQRANTLHIEKANFERRFTKWLNIRTKKKTTPGKRRVNSQTPRFRCLKAVPDQEEG